MGDFLLNNNEEEKLLPRLLAGAVLGDILKLHMQLNATCDKKASVSLGISGVILIITLTKMTIIFNPDFNYGIFLKMGFATTILACIVSIILSVLVILPKIVEEDRLNLFYYGSFSKMISSDEYVLEMKNLLNDREKIIEQYAKEIYDLGTLDLMKRFNLLKYSSKSLTVGLISGTITLVIYIINLMC